MKRLSLALAAIGLSASVGAFAALPANTDPTLVAVPLLPGGFYIGGTINYLEPTDTNGDWDYVIVNRGSGNPYSSDINNIEPRYEVGWAANVGYIFPGTGNNIDLSYQWYRGSEDEDETPTPGSYDFIAPSHFEDFDLEDTTTAHGDLDVDLDRVDLTAGQYINVGCRLIMHPYFGGSYVRIDRDIESDYIEGGFDHDTLHIDEDSKFDGGGPIAGVDATYYIGAGFGAVAHAASALILGDIDTEANAIHYERNVAGTVLGSERSHLDADGTRRIVPVTDLKGGLDWTYLLNNVDNSDLTLEVGYQWSNYFNSMDRVSGQVASTDGVFPLPAFAAERETSDLGLHGPYATLTFHA